MIEWKEKTKQDKTTYKSKLYACINLSVSQQSDTTWGGILQIGNTVVAERAGFPDVEEAKKAITEAYVAFIEKCVNDIGVGFIRKKTILVIEDEEGLSKVVRKFLVKQGYDVLVAHNGQEGFQVLESSSVDLIITDLKMPVMGGETFLHKLKSQYASTMPVIVVTAYGTVEKAVELMKLGVCDFLTKPVDLPRLKEAVVRALQEF